MRGCCSSWREVCAGVPQGSILGPLLYLIYAEDIKDHIHGTLRTFADDTMISAAATTEALAAKILQPDIRQLNVWARQWKIDLNTMKTVCLTVNRCGGARCFLTMEGTLVREVMSHRHLGVILSYDGKWTAHLNDICQSVSKRLNVLRQYYKTFTKRNLLVIYRSFIRPKMEFSSQILSNLNIGEVERLENLQRSALRMICGAKVGTSHGPLYEEVRLELLETRRKNARLVKHSLQTVQERNPLARRRLTDYTLIKCNTVQYQRSYLPRTIKD